MAKPQPNFRKTKGMKVKITFTNMENDRIIMERVVNTWQDMRQITETLQRLFG